MNRIIIVTLLLITSRFHAQKAYNKLPTAKEHNPTVIFNQKIIGNENLLKRYGESKDERKKVVNNISVLKDEPEKGIDNYYNLSEYGVVFVELKQTIPITANKTQAELNIFFGLDKTSDVYVDGYLVESKDYKISLTGISDIELIYPDNKNKLQSPVLNIWTLPLEKRYRAN